MILKLNGKHKLLSILTRNFSRIKLLTKSTKMKKILGSRRNVSLIRWMNAIPLTFLLYKLVIPTILNLNRD